MVDGAREVCYSVRVGGKNPKNVWWNDVVMASVERKKALCWELGMRLQKTSMKIFKKEEKGG